MAAPVLQQLREAIQRNEEISVTPTGLVLGDGTTTLSRKEATNFLALRGRGPAYELDAVYFQWKLRDIPYETYVKTCAKEGASHVKLVDKPQMLAYLSGEIAQCSGLVRAEAPKPEPKSTTVKTEVAEEVEAQPRAQRSIDSVLMVPEWDFSSLREKLAKHIATAKRSKPAADRDGAGGKPSFDPRGDRYTNNENRFWRENMGSDFQEFGINPTGSFASAKKSAQPEARKEAPTGAPARKEAAAVRPSSSRKRKAVDPSELRPIIIVPGRGLSLVNTVNVKEFFEEGHFISEEDMRKRGIAPDLSGRIKARRQPGRNCSMAEYLLVSNVNRLSEAEWKRVVAVICTGKIWQFKNWAIKGDIVEILRQVQGFYFHYDDMAPDPTAASWAVKLMPISRSKRYTDGHAQLQFFTFLDAFIQGSTKPLRY